MSLHFQRAVFYKPKHVMTKAYYKRIQEIIYNLSVDLMTFDLKWITLNVKSRTHNFQEVVRHNYMVHLMIRVCM